MFPAPFVLETERLTLRAAHPDSAAAVNDALRESWPELSLWMLWAVGDPPPLVETVAFSRVLQEKFVQGSDFSYDIFRRSDTAFLGKVSLFGLDAAVPKGEIGYWLRTSALGHGYMTEASAAVVRMAREQLRLVRVEIRCDAKNLRSRAVAERLGFDCEGVLRRECRNPQGGLRDTAIYAKINP